MWSHSPSEPSAKAVVWKAPKISETDPHLLILRHLPEGRGQLGTSAEIDTPARTLSAFSLYPARQVWTWCAPTTLLKWVGMCNWTTHSCCLAGAGGSEQPTAFSPCLARAGGHVQTQSFLAASLKPGGMPGPPCPPTLPLKLEGTRSPHRKYPLDFLALVCQGGWILGLHGTVRKGRTILGRLPWSKHSTVNWNTSLVFLWRSPIYCIPRLRDRSQVGHKSRNYRRALRKHPPYTLPWPVYNLLVTPPHPQEKA